MCAGYERSLVCFSWAQFFPRCRVPVKVMVSKAKLTKAHKELAREQDRAADAEARAADFESALAAKTSEVDRLNQLNQHLIDQVSIEHIVCCLHRDHEPSQNTMAESSSSDCLSSQLSVLFYSARAQ